MTMAHPGEFAEAVLDSVLCVAPACGLAQNQSYREMVAVIKDSIVPNGWELLKTGQPVSKLSLMPCVDEGVFALVFSMSHMVADGYTYYSILNMLSSSCTTMALTAERMHHTAEAQIEAGGKEDQEWQMGMPMICNVICSLMCSKATKLYAYYVDEDKIAALKQKAKATAKDPDAFVSTNDILTAHFANATDRSIMLMAMNFRGRVDGVTEDLAGNYETALVFDRDSCYDPISIRQTLKNGPPFERTSGAAIPGCCNTCCSQDLGLITNWASFFSGES